MEASLGYTGIVSKIRIVCICFMTFGFWSMPTWSLTLQEQAIIAIIHGKVIERDLQGLRQTLQKHPEYIDAPNHEGLSPLQSAVQRNDIDVVDILLSMGADVNFQNFGNNHNTALHYSKLSVITQRLIDAGANPNAFDQRGITPLLRLLMSRGLTAENIHVLLEGGARTDVIIPGQESTALHILFSRRLSEHAPSYREVRVYKRQLKIAKYLVEHGVDVNATTVRGFTALHFAARGGYVDSVAFLVNRGADIDAIDLQRRQTPMMYALGVREMEVVEELMLLGGRFDIPNNRGLTVEEILKKLSLLDSRFVPTIKIMNQSICAKPLSLNRT